MATDDMAVTLEYVRRYNLGSYQHEEIKISVTGPYTALRDGTKLIADLSVTSSALGALANTVYLTNRQNDATVFPPRTPPTNG